MGTTPSGKGQTVTSAGTTADGAGDSPGSGAGDAASRTGAATTHRERLAAIEAKWAERWEQEGLHVAEPQPGRPKFFATYPYSYMNAFAHVGHAYTMGRVDFMVRYQRLKGHNILFPMGFHVTGTPIVAAAARVANEDPVQWRILRESGIPEDEIPRFSDPHHWVEYFPNEWRKDIGDYGLAIDWRRSFLTTDKNPYYDAFIRWQFLRLKEGGYVRRGKHPVIWDPVEKAVIGDHDRAEGEGVAPQEAVLLTFPIQGEAGTSYDGTGRRHLVAATLRPETVFGQTNLWVDPEVEYVEVEAPGGTWIVSVECAAKMRLQDLGIGDEIERVPGADLVGKTVVAPGVEREIPVFPARFMKTEKWTGIVTSVPSDAPLDHVALRDLQADPEPFTRHGGDITLLNNTQPIEIIETEGLGTFPAKTVVDRHKVKDQDDAEKLKAATEEVYADAFYKGRMLEHCGRFGGMSVQEAKEAVKAWLLETNQAHRMWEPESRVVSRHGHEALVKVVSDQWFVAYGDKAWKEKAHEAIDGMAIYPEAARKQFHIVVDWLRDWACTREHGLGTRLPWDEKWLIESLSDSTVYMAYYTISHHLERLQPPVDDLSPAFWDHVMLGKGDAEGVATEALPVAEVERMRAEFEYWYPLDFRNSGKDLVQNHLTFAVFNHTALFPEDKWMQGIAVNGWVTVDGEKMSKSKGNFITLRQALSEFGISETRFAVASAGESMDDANFEVDVAAGASRRLATWLDQMTALWDGANGAGTHDGSKEGSKEGSKGPDGAPDRWFDSVLHRTLHEVDEHMGRAEFRTALKLALHGLDKEWSWYVRRNGGHPAPAVARRYVDAQCRLMAVYVPHLAEELWHHMGNDGSVADAAFPAYDPAAVDPQAERQERYLGQVMDDIRSILRILDKNQDATTGAAEPERIILYTTPSWKQAAEDAVAHLLEELPEGQRPNPGDAIKVLMGDPDLRPHAKLIPKIVNQLLKSGAGLVAERAHRQGLHETEVLRDAAAFLEQEFGCPVQVYAADDERKDDPAGRAGAAMPGRPAVFVATPGAE